MLRIEIRNYPVFMKLGYHSEERFKAQNVLISLNLSVAPEADPGLSDDLTKAVDYGRVTHLIDELLNDREYKLIETIVHTVGEGILTRFSKVTQLRVTVEKTCLPQSQMKTSRVRITREFDREETRP